MKATNETGERFDRMLTITTELFFEFENELLLQPVLGELLITNPHPSVLDVGSGNGAYLSLLSRRYPELRCVGLEKDPTIFPFAKKKADDSNLIFLPLAYEDYEEDERVYDFILIRLAAVHLADRNHFSQWLRRRTKPGSVVLIVDADDSFSDASGPDHLPLFHALYTDARRQLSVSKLMRFQDVLAIELAHAGFRQQRLVSYRIEGRTPSTKRTLRAYMEVVTLMHGQDPADDHRVSEWEHWMNNRSAGYSIGMFGLVLTV